MKPRPILHDSTQKAVDAFVGMPSHALGLIGPAGAGKAYLAEYIARQILDSAPPSAVHYLRPEPSTITIEQIRSLQNFLILKVPGKQPIRRVVIIEQAETMGDEAQNALLKTLEEPPADTVFILTTDGAAGLRPTIYSRIQQIRVLPITRDTAAKRFSGDITKAYHLSGGYVGMLHGLLNDKDHVLTQSVQTAKEIMRLPMFERLTMIDGIAKDKFQIAQVFYALERVIGAALVTGSETQAKRLVGSLRAVYQAKIDLGKSANPKLLLTDLFLSL